MERTSVRYASKSEQDLLLSLYEEHRQLLENNEFTMDCKKEKAETWKNIQKTYNSAGFGASKSVQQLKRMWQHMRSKAKKESIKKKQTRRVGGGLSHPKDVNSTMENSRMLSVINQDVFSICEAQNSVEPNCTEDDNIKIEILDHSVSDQELDNDLAEVLPVGRQTNSHEGPAPLTSQESEPPTLVESVPRLPPTSAIESTTTGRRKYHRTTKHSPEEPHEESMELRRQEFEMDMKVKRQDLANKQLHNEILEMELKIKKMDYLMKLKSFQDLGFDPKSIPGINDN